MASLVDGARFACLSNCAMPSGAPDSVMSGMSSGIGNSASRSAPRTTIDDPVTRFSPRKALSARPDLTLGLLITLGSPLGMPDVVCRNKTYTQDRHYKREPS